MDSVNPVDTVTRFVEAMNRQDLETALNMYEPGATLIVEPGKAVNGTVELRQALAGMLELKPSLSTETYELVQAGDLALYCGRWLLTGTDPNGAVVEMRGSSSDVLRRQADGSWLIALDNPWGTGILS